jgi:hypothetical protein
MTHDAERSKRRFEPHANHAVHTHMSMQQQAPSSGDNLCGVEDLTRVSHNRWCPRRLMGGTIQHGVIHTLPWHRCKLGIAYI